MPTNATRLSDRQLKAVKRCGIVVDYYGVANHLREALAAYADEDIEGALSSIKDEVPVLRDRHLRVVDVLRRQGIESLEDAETCIAALESEKVRAEFAVKLKAFLNSLDTVLPRPEGLPFVKDAKRLAYIHARARGRYKDLPQLGKDVGANPQPAELLRLKDVTVELVDLLVGELQSHRDIWSPRKRAAQEELAGQLFDYLMRLRPPLVDSDTAGVLSDRLMDQARASHERLMQL